MRIAECQNCGRYMKEDDSNPAIHYSNPATICSTCQCLEKSESGDWLQRANGEYYQKDSTPPQRTYEQGIAQGKWEMLQDTDLLTVNILRSWERQRIVTFAKHLLGSEYPTYEQGAEDFKREVVKLIDAAVNDGAMKDNYTFAAICALPTQSEGEAQ